MLLRDREIKPDPSYPPDEWRYVETQFNEHTLAANESLMAVSNGYLGIRGSHDENDPAVESGTFVNGFYESWPIEYPEQAYGLARNGQTMVNVPDGHIVRLFVDDEPLYLPTADLLEYRRTLELREGMLTRELLWLTNFGKRVRVRSKRLVSFEHRHVAAVWYQVTLLDSAAAIDIVSEIDGRFEESRGGGDDPRVGKKFDARMLEHRHHECANRRMILSYSARRSGMSLSCGVDHELSTDCEVAERVMCDEALGKLIFSAKMQPNDTITIAKFLVYHSSRHTAAEDLKGRVHRTLDRVTADGIDVLIEAQKRRTAKLWEYGDVEILGDVAVQQALRFNLFHLMQATARAEGSGVPAKGLTGQGYEGHYFWDTEMFVLPYLIYTEPRIARALLKFRFGQLQEARRRAREVSEHGALFPWRTINGEEASAYYAAGTAQYHINADIAYALRKYVDATGDLQLLIDDGAEVLVETARFWSKLGFFSERRGGAFCINGVTGPDEYNTVVDNNLYTNLMARENLVYAADVVALLGRKHPDVLTALRRRTGLTDDEPAEWRRAAEQMLIPYDEERGIHLQDDGFLDKEPWDFDNTPATQYPLLLHYHPLVIYRHRVIKQADVVLAMFLIGDAFTLEQKRRNFDFYDPLTTGDSSLSVCVQAVLAAELSYEELAYKFARYAALMDLANINENVEHGCHIASMGGTWMMIVYGLAGFRDYGGQFRFAPMHPKRFGAVRFTLRLRGGRVQVALEQECVRYTLLEGTSFVFRHYDKPLILEGEGQTLEFGYAAA